MDLSLETTDLLVQYADGDQDDLKLRAYALMVAGRAEEALSVTHAQNQAAGFKALRAIAHIVTGSMQSAFHEACDALQSGDLSALESRQIPWIQAYSAAAIGRPSPAGFAARWSGDLPDDKNTPTVAIFDYKSPDIDRNSLNIGDWIQTLAAVRHLARFEGVCWTFDDPALSAVFERLRNTWDRSERIECSGRAHLAVIDRDYPASARERLSGRKVWVIANGWYADTVFGDTRCWPMPQEFEPLLLSVHIDKASDLEPHRLEWLKRHGPVGCRDRATERWLLNQGVPAYFSGCLTMTLGLQEGVDSGEKISVDVPAQAGWVQIAHEDVRLRRSTLPVALDRSMNLLQRYAAASEIRTSRLHCFLPARAVGARVTFEPSDISDRRFEGLIAGDERSQESIVSRLNETMARTLSLILQGSGAEDVRKVLNEQATFPEREIRAPPNPSSLWLRSEKKRDVVVTLAFDENFVIASSTVLLSIRKATSANISVVLLTRGVPEEVAMTVASLAQPFDCKIFAMDSHLRKCDLHLEQHTTISTMDRLYLCQLLPEHDRVVYVDSDTLVFDDIAELASLETGETGIAARTLPGPFPANIAYAVEKCARSLDRDRSVALREWAAQNTDLSAPCFNAGVLVLSLNKMRASGVAAAALDLVHRFGLNDQDALVFACGGRAATIPRGWNMMTHLDLCEAPKLIHWAGRLKPWMALPVHYGPEWKNMAAEARKWLEAPRVETELSDGVSQSRYEIAISWVPAAGRVAEVAHGARARASGARLAIRLNGREVVQVDADDSSFPTGAFDAVAILGIIESLERPGAFLRRVRRSTDTLIVSFAALHPAANKVLRRARGWLNAHTESAFEELLNRQGWRIDRKAFVNEDEAGREYVYRCVPSQG